MSDFSRRHLQNNFMPTLPDAVAQRCSVEKGVLRNFTKFTGKVTTLLKKRLWHRCFPVNFVKFVRTPFFYRTALVAASSLLLILPSNFAFNYSKKTLNLALSQCYLLAIFQIIPYNICHNICLELLPYSLKISLDCFK